MRRAFILIAAVVFSCAFFASAQDDSPSLGDIARQSRLQKQQQKDAQPAASKGSSASGSATAPAVASATVKPAAKTSHVITNENIGLHDVSDDTPATSAQDATKQDPKESDAAVPPVDRNEQAERWKSQIQAQKSNIADLQNQISAVSASISFVGGNCVENCVEWNENQKRKQDEVEKMKTQLEDAKQRLSDMQDTARKQGFGGNVYDPEAGSTQ